MSVRLLRLPLTLGASAPRLQLDAPRLAWAGRVMQATWMPRFEAVRAALFAVELEQLASGALGASAADCRLEDVPALAAQLRPWALAAIPLGASAAAPPDNADPAAITLRYRFALAHRDHTAALADALAADDIGRLLQLAAFPTCCRAALLRALAAGENLPLAIHARGAASAAAAAACAGAAESPAEANALLQPLGLAAVAHIPCSANCPASQALGRERLAQGAAAGQAQAMDHLRAVLAWPASYSQRNGIVEVQTAALRLVQEAAQREPQLTYRWRPPTAAANTAAAGSGADSPAIAADTDLDNPAAADYGFASLYAWRMRQAAVVWEQSRRLRGGGSFIDLACADGYLLQLVEAETQRLSVFGLDRSQTQIARAQRRLPHRSPCLRQGSIAELAAHAVDGRYDFALLRPEDLLPLPEPERRHSLRAIFGAARQVLAYASDQALRRHGSLADLLAAAGLAAVQAPAATDVSAEVRPLP